VGTVRKAIDALVADGLLERQQGRGTFVRRPSFDGSLFRFFRFQGDGRTGSVIPESQLLGREVIQPTPDHVAAALRLQAHDKTIRISRLRLSSRVPVLLEDIWLSYRRFKPMLTAGKDEIGPLLYPAYERLCGEVVARAEETLTVGVADETDARLLDVAPGAVLIKIDRLAFGFDGRPLEWRRSHGRSDNFQYRVEIR
jgi:GntR family transcriptional regulator